MNNLSKIIILIAAMAISFSYAYSIRPEPVEITRIVTERVCSKADIYAAAIPASALQVMK